MSCLTKLYYHTGTTSPTDIGPASGGVLYSLAVLTSSADQVTVKDGGSGGTVILAGSASLLFQKNQLRWEGIRLGGQLNIELGNSAVAVIAEIGELP